LVDPIILYDNDALWQILDGFGSDCVENIVLGFGSDDVGNDLGVERRAN
jgi:hypothetical protein